MPDWDVSNAVIGLGAKVLVAPVATALPGYIGDTVNVAFESLGSVTDDGMTITPSRDQTTKKVWQSRADALIIPNGQSFEVKMALVEWTNTNFGLWYGGGAWAAIADHTGQFKFDVSGDPDIDERAFYFEWRVGTKTWGLGIPHGQVTSVGDAKLVNGDWSAVDITIRALATDTDPLATFITDSASVNPA